MTTPAPVKPGWKTTEFYVHLLVATVNALVVSDLLVPGSTAMKIVSLVALVLQAFGYQVSRARAKAATASSGPSSPEAGFVHLDVACAIAFGGLVLFGASMTACKTLGGTGDNVKAAAIDCGSRAALKATAEYGALLEHAIMSVTRDDGTVDQPSLAEVTKGLLAETGWCAVENVATRMLRARLASPDAPQSAPLLVSAAELARALGAIREARYGGQEFRPAAAGQ